MLDRSLICGPPLFTTPPSALKTLVLSMLEQNQMSSHSYHTASRGSRSNSRVSPQPPTPTYLFCRQCDTCPTCGSSPPTAPVPAPVPAPAPAPAPATSPTPTSGPQAQRILPQLPIQFLFTLFLLEHQLTGDWRHLIIPYAACFLTQHRVDVEEFLEKQEAINNLANVFTGLDITDDVDNLANVLTGLVVTDDGPDVRGQQHSKLFSSRDDFQDSLPDVPLAFQSTSPAEAISSIQSLVNTVPMRTAPPTRKERRQTLDKLVDCVGAIVPRADVEVNEVEVDVNTEHHFEDPIGGHDTVAQIVILFAIISNVVVGLATDRCNLLIDVVTLISKLTMSLSSFPAPSTVPNSAMFSPSFRRP
ncbi:hypothetical protein DFH07DRAFT_974384 [Mycena maculata]|uniref:Uncharacterized protein n=1 Tax=Mycena maculata TaxID=230809 RepID=A0AAD7MF89_9AGAR|nr:hypothetical protein DFH07DRAFT_974384 [Mycena maculata]